MEFQELLALAIVGTTAATFLIAAVRRRAHGHAGTHGQAREADCSQGCSCSGIRRERTDNLSPSVESPAGKE